MDMSVVASTFDNQPAYDAYSGTLLFTGQVAPYAGGLRDSVASWRQAISAQAITKPARGVITLGSEKFLTGRVVQDFFQGSIVRENLVLHPCDGLYLQGSAAAMVTSTLLAELTPFYSNAVWRKTDKDEAESSEFYNLCDLYLSVTEAAPVRDNMILSAAGILYRIRSVEAREGGFTAAVCSELGAHAILAATYTPNGVYSPALDALVACTPISTTVIIERVQSNYRFSTADAAAYEPSDRVVTVAVAAVTLPKASDTLTVGGVGYRVISVQKDEPGTCWELHCRRV